MCLHLHLQRWRFFYKPWRPNVFFQFEISVKGLVSSFRFIWIPCMFWIYGKYKCLISSVLKTVRRWKSWLMCFRAVIMVTLSKLITNNFHVLFRSIGQLQNLPSKWSDKTTLCAKKHFLADQAYWRSSMLLLSCDSWYITINPLNTRLLCYCTVSETRLFYDVIVISCNQTRRSPGLVSEWTP